MWGQLNTNSSEGNTANNVLFVCHINNVLPKSKQCSNFSETLGQVAEFDNLPVVSANTTKSK